MKYQVSPHFCLISFSQVITIGILFPIALPIEIFTKFLIHQKFSYQFYSYLKFLIIVEKTLTVQLEGHSPNLYLVFFVSWSVLGRISSKVAALVV